MNKEDDDDKEVGRRSRRFAWCDDDVKGLKIITSKNITSNATPAPGAGDAAKK